MLRGGCYLNKAPSWAEGDLNKAPSLLLEEGLRKHLIVYTACERQASSTLWRPYLNNNYSDKHNKAMLSSW